MGNRYQGGYPTREVASEAINGLRMSINEDRHRRQDRTITVADLADHYTRVELCDGSHVHTAACVLAGILMQHADPGAVSYTHLDVYKRQRLAHSPRAGRA